MELAAMARIGSVRIERNSEFESLGFVSHSRPRMLVYISSEGFIPQLLDNPAFACAVTTPELACKLPTECGLALAEDPRRAFFEFHNWLATETDFYWADFEAEISQKAVIDPAAYIAEKNIRIGPGTVVEPGAVVLERSIIGAEVVLRTGCTIGCHGFEFKRFGHEVLRVAHGGGVLLHDRVEIQNNAGVDRSVFGGFTQIGEDTKIDTLVHIGHNAQIGRRCLIASGTLVAGSATVGDDVWIGPAASISSEVTVGDGASITIGSVVTKDVAPGQRVTGNFAIDHDKFLAFLRTIR